MTAVLLSIWGCNRYDDTDLWDKVDSLEERIARLEKLCNEMNTNISSLENIVTALQNNDYVTDVTSIIESGKEIGFTITFSKSGRVVIYHGENGADGEAGEPGKDGADGADGKDGHTPVIGVKKDADGIYYWTLDGEWITDSEGNKIPTTGKDGTDGEDGEDGKPGTPGQDGEDGADGEQGKPGQDGADGITPLLKIEDDYWYISYDNGKSWQQLYKAVGEDGAAGADGTDGAPGKDGQSFFQSVDTTNPNYIILTLADGSRIKIPTWKAFEELQVKVNQINTNLAALQTILKALQNSDYVTEITHLTAEDGSEVGYTIYFSKSQPVTIYHGKDGVDGAPGQDGEDGEDGEDGKDGHTPVIGIKKATEEDWSLDNSWAGDPSSDYYWTIDGEWLTDSDGNKIPATGQHGRTPLLKIEDGQWYISTDNGKTWKAEGPATGSNVESIFSNISYTSEYLYLTLATGETISLSRHEEKMSIACSIEPVEITDQSATFIGRIDLAAEELMYGKVTLYYSNAQTFNIHTARSKSTSSFDYNQGFEITINDLRPETRYTYCLYARGQYSETYGPVREFQTAVADTIRTHTEIRNSLRVYYAQNHNDITAGTITSPEITVTSDGIIYQNTSNRHTALFSELPLYAGSEIELSIIPNNNHNPNYAIGFDSEISEDRYIWDTKNWKSDLSSIVIPESHIWTATTEGSDVMYLERQTGSFIRLNPGLNTDELHSSDYRYKLRVTEDGFDIFKDNKRIYQMSSQSSNPYLTHFDSPVYFCFSTGTGVGIKIHSLKQMGAYGPADKDWIVIDGFDRDDTGRTLGSAETGQTWEHICATASYMRISNCRAVPLGSGHPSALIDIETDGDRYVECEVNLENTDGQILLYPKYLNGTNYIAARVDRNGLHLLYKLDGKNYVVKADSSLPGSSFKLGVECTGNVFSVYTNGTKVLEGEINQHMEARKVGFSVNNESNSVDNFKAKKL